MLHNMRASCALFVCVCIGACLLTSRLLIGRLREQRHGRKSRGDLPAAALPELRVERHHLSVVEPEGPEAPRVIIAVRGFLHPSGRAKVIFCKDTKVLTKFWVLVRTAQLIVIPEHLGNDRSQSHRRRPLRPGRFLRIAAQPQSPSMMVFFFQKAGPPMNRDAIDMLLLHWGSSNGMHGEGVRPSALPQCIV